MGRIDRQRQRDDGGDVSDGYLGGQLQHRTAAQLERINDRQDQRGRG